MGTIGKKFAKKRDRAIYEEDENGEIKPIKAKKILKPPERFPEVPVIGREENPGGCPFQERWADFRWGVSRLITLMLWNFQRVLHILAATQEVPPHTRLSGFQMTAKHLRCIFGSFQ